ncbi:MAG: sialate O-acetylesterase [Eubacteriales bacterium]|nr:sialate O-acetylesterase [Eubacteriales bacterium]
MNHVQLNPIFSDHMVLQCRKEVKVWGTCGKDSHIRVTLNERCVSAEVNGEEWIAKLPPMEAKSNLTLSVISEEGELTVHDVAVGEVWIAGGQSNMEFYMKYEAGFSEAIKDCRNMDIRFFDVPEICYQGQEQDFDFSRMGFWRVCNSENLEYYSAVSYYFARKLQEDIGVPVGIIGCNRGESPVSSWLPSETVMAEGRIWQKEFENSLQGQSEKEALEVYRCETDDRGDPFAQEFNNRLLYGISHEEQQKLLVEMESDSKKVIASFHTKPGSLYENMLLSIVPYTVCGVIWYQGETDSQHTETYRALWSRMIDCWRDLWKEEFPFFCVQLAPFEQWLWCRGDNFPIIREIQQEISREKRKVYLISSSDAGMQYDIHPKDKKAVGIRLALSVEKYIYGRNVSADAPMAEEGYREGEDLCIRFVCDADSLELRGHKISSLTVRKHSGTETQEIDLSDIRTELNGLVLRLKGIYRKVCGELEVRYASTGYYKVNLYSSAGIPAMPFTCIVKEKTDVSSSNT